MYWYLEQRISADSNSFKLVTVLSNFGLGSAVEVKPLYNADVTGVIICQVTINGFAGNGVVDTGSAVCLIRDSFAVAHGIQFAKVLGPQISAVAEDCFKILEICVVTINILGYIATGNCGVVDKFPYDILLGMDFLVGAPLMIDLARRIMFNSIAPQVWASTYMMFLPQ